MIEKVERVILIGYQVRCVCGVARPLEETWTDACCQAEAAGWEVNSEANGHSCEDYCPRCWDEREAAFDRRFEVDEDNPG